MTIFTRLLRLERRHAPIAAAMITDEDAPDAARVLRIIELLASAYERKCGNALPATTRAAWRAELLAPGGLNDFAQRYAAATT